MTIESALTFLSTPDAYLWLLGAGLALRLAAAGINLAVAVHRGVGYFRKKSK
jgi:hypothetical protein